MRRKQRPSVQFDVGSDMSARGENPFQVQRIDSRPVRSVCPLEHNERRHRFHRKLESSVKETRPMRRGQDPPKANPRVPNARILGPARNRVPTANPNLELPTPFLRPTPANAKKT